MDFSKTTEHKINDRISNRSISILDPDAVNSNRVIILPYEDNEEDRNVLYYTPLQQDESNSMSLSSTYINMSNSDENSKMIIQTNDNISNKTETVGPAENIYNIEHVEECNNTVTEQNESESSISTTQGKGTLTKKRKRIPESWARNIRKTKRERGEEYVDIKKTSTSSKTS